MSRATIKELYARLDEMKAQRDDARKQLQELMDDASNNKAYRIQSDRAPRDNATCHDLLDAYQNRYMGPNEFNIGSMRMNDPIGAAHLRPLSHRLAALIATVCVQEGRLLQADLIRQEALNTKPSEAL